MQCKNNSGYIVVETVGAFVPFMLLVVSILSLVNIITLQARVHYALTQAAGALSMYCYVTEATGAAEGLAAMDSSAAAFSDNIDGVLGGIRALSGGGGGLDGGRVYGAAEAFAGNPGDMIKGFANYGLNELRNEASSRFAEPLVKRYLATGGMAIDEYLRRLRVVSFEISDCVIIDRNDNVSLTAEYEIEYTFGALRLPFTPTLRISQTARTKAWLGGSGERYRFEK